MPKGISETLLWIMMAMLLMAATVAILWTVQASQQRAANEGVELVYTSDAPDEIQAVFENSNAGVYT